MTAPAPLLPIEARRAMLDRIMRRLLLESPLDNPPPRNQRDDERDEDRHDPTPLYSTSNDAA